MGPPWGLFKEVMSSQALVDDPKPSIFKQGRYKMKKRMFMLSIFVFFGVIG